MNIFFINIGGRKMKKDLLQIELETQFKWFHAHPELSYQEYETTSRLKKLLKELGTVRSDMSYRSCSNN